MSIHMKLQGHLKDGDVHLRYPQVIEQQVHAILASNGMTGPPSRVVDWWKDNDVPGKTCEMRLSEGNLDRVEKVLLEAFRDASQCWSLRDPAVKILGMRQFMYYFERRSERTTLDDSSELTRWFDAQENELPAREGVYEGAATLIPGVYGGVVGQGYFHWDGSRWGRRGDTAIHAKSLRSWGHSAGVRYWRGRTAE